VPLRRFVVVIGFTILVPFFVRVVWRLYSGAPPLPDGMSLWQVRLSKLSHGALYFLMIAMPVTGYLGNFGGVDYGVFQVPAFAPSPLWLPCTSGAYRRSRVSAPLTVRRRLRGFAFLSSGGSSVSAKP
jgi:cytochrome b561